MMKSTPILINKPRVQILMPGLQGLVLTKKPWLWIEKLQYIGLRSLSHFSHKDCPHAAVILLDM